MHLAKSKPWASATPPNGKLENECLAKHFKHANTWTNQDQKAKCVEFSCPVQRPSCLPRGTKVRTPSKCSEALKRKTNSMEKNGAGHSSSFSAAGFANSDMFLFAQADLPIVDVPTLEADLAIRKVVMPTPKEFGIEADAEGAHFSTDRLLVLGEAAAPLVQGLGIGPANREGWSGFFKRHMLPLTNAADLPEGHETRTRKDPLANEIRTADVRCIALIRDTNSLNGNSAPKLEALIDGCKVLRQKFVSDCFDHFATHNFREAPDAKC
mmetsp:Transcript_34421/g.112007  ORF Transcript_34421/g.112007 Transcript_34421/m.112007 type:complete len:268 (+) Transcript_34421:2-805(+)